MKKLTILLVVVMMGVVGGLFAAQEELGCAEFSIMDFSPDSINIYDDPDEILIGKWLIEMQPGSDDTTDKALCVNAIFNLGQQSTFSTRCLANMWVVIDGQWYNLDDGFEHTFYLNQPVMVELYIMNLNSPEINDLYVSELYYSIKFYFETMCGITENISSSQKISFYYENPYQDFKFKEGWTAFSFKILPNSHTKEVYLENIIGQGELEEVEYLLVWDNAIADYVSVNLHSNLYDYIVDGRGFFLRAQSEIRGFASGVFIDSITTNLPEGWHLIGTLDETYLFDPENCITATFQYRDGYFYPISGGYVPGEAYFVYSLGGVIARGYVPQGPGKVLAGPPENPEQFVARLESQNDVSGQIVAPVGFELKQNYPNPFNPSTVVEFNLPECADVTLTVYNNLGQEVMRTEGQFEAGANSFNLDFNNSDLAAGAYIYKLQAGGYTAVKRMSYIK